MIQPYKITYTSVVQALVYASSIEEAEQLFQDGECVEEQTVSDTSSDPIIVQMHNIYKGVGNTQ